MATSWCCCCCKHWSRIKWLQSRIFALTFLSYASYTLARLPASIAKSTLHPDNVTISDPGYAPFNESNGGLYLGILDTLFLSAYAAGLFVSGSIGDRVNLRYFMGFGMLGAGGAVVLFGFAEAWGIHAFGYFGFCNILAGLFQSTGWPANVTVMSRWFPKETRGTVMGVWNAHSSIGNILGKVIATAALSAWGWQAAYLLPGTITAGVGVIELLFLIPHPRDVISGKDDDKGLLGGKDVPQPVLNSDDNSKQAAHSQAELGQLAQDQEGEHPSISFLTALQVPGVLAFSTCLFFSKLVAYSFIFWLPYYLKHIGYTVDGAGNWSIVYDVGGVIGGILAGWLSDRWKARGIVSFTMLLLTIPGLYLYSVIASHGDIANAAMMVVVGILVNGPYTLVSSAVAADLGSHDSLRGNPKAMSTVTGIIDGTGSIGAALQGVLIGVVSDNLGWSAVFYMLMGMCLISAATILRIVKSEWTTFRSGHVRLNSQLFDSAQQGEQYSKMYADAVRSSSSISEDNRKR